MFVGGDHRLEGKLGDHFLPCVSPEVNEADRFGKNFGQGAGEIGGGVQGGDPAILAGGNDLFVSAAGANESGDATGHGLKGGIGQAFVDRRDDEEVESPVAEAGLGLETEEVNEWTEGTRL